MCESQQDLSAGSASWATAGAEERNVEDLTPRLLHYDEDYDRIAAITGQHVRWIAPRGSLG